MSLLIDAQGELLVDGYTALADDAPLPAGAAITVSLVRWQAEPTSLQSHSAAVGVRLTNTADVLALKDMLLSRPLIVLDFPAFADGRAYSQARLLRERFGYSGQLRASGASVIADQVVGMVRVGFTELHLREGQSLETCRKLLHALPPVAYQPAVDHTKVALLQRQH